MGTDSYSESGCLIPALALLKAQLRTADAKGAKVPKSTGKAKPSSNSKALHPSATPIGAILSFCEKVNKSAQRQQGKKLLDAAEGYLDEITALGAAVLTQCKVPVRVEYEAQGQFANGKGFQTTKSTVAAAEAAVRAQKPKCTLKKVREVYFGSESSEPLLCIDFVHPDFGYDDFKGEQQLYFRVAESSLWSSSGKPKKALLALCERLAIAPDALAPVSWVSISY